MLYQRCFIYELCKAFKIFLRRTSLEECLYNNVHINYPCVEIVLEKTF